MAYATAQEDLLDKTGGSVYKLVIMAAKRALEIAEGQPPMIAVESSLKPSTIAIKEIAAGKIHYRKTKE